MLPHSSASAPAAARRPPPSADPGLPPPSSTASFWHSEPSSFLHNHRTTPTVPTDADIVIIGSGLAGATTARYLYESSAAPAIVMLDARQACWGATGRNGGHCKASLYTLSCLPELATTLGYDQLTKLMAFQQLNVALVTEYVRAEAVDCDFRPMDSCDAFFTEDNFRAARESIDVLRKRMPEYSGRLRVVTRDTTEGRRILAQETRTPTAVGAVLSSAACLWPYKLVAHMLERAVRERGMNLQTCTPALSVVRNTGSGRKWTVITARGNINTDKVVFATNAHTAHLLPAFKGHIYPVRGQMSALVPPKSMIDRPLTHTYRLVGKDGMMDQYLIQRPIQPDGSGGELMLGGGRSLAAGFGEGRMDGAIDPPVARYLRRAPAEFFAGETGFPGEAVVGGLEKSLVSKFRRLTIDAVVGSQLRFWDAAEGIGCDDGEEEDSDSGSEYDDDNSESITQDSQGSRECVAKYEWSGVMGFSSDEMPWVGRVPALTAEEARARGLEAREAVMETEGLWMLAGFEGHGMAYCTGAAKALVQMMAGKQPYDFFPECLEASRQRMGLAPEEDEEEDEEEVDAEEEDEVEEEVDIDESKVDIRWEDLEKDEESEWVVV
ncbi:DAO-domain-containing protein [Morchella conica CCBAS932]|uniref:DAO-domain-containing protein n=1 Tax=Morchella conica CCBAS932 TaxID=1392247 RepID=A0A3N4KX25_9PEZI|nr:DAO-domain-containing protein [Morchella conica CCBAS932]